MKNFVALYYYKLEEIEEYKDINRQIAEFNKTTIRKNQKKLLDVPPKPSFPTFRFFRDLMVLKGMVRS